MKPIASVTLILLLFSCKKENALIANTCAALYPIAITSNSPVNIGETMQLSCPEIKRECTYSWTGPNNYTSQNNSNSIVNAELKNEGWYFVSVSTKDCPTAKLDSVYFDIKNQGTPACNSSINTCTYSDLTNDTYSSVQKSINPAYNVLTLSAKGSATLEILFHPIWKTTEPEDGIYYTINTASFDKANGNYNKVYVTMVKQSNNWGSQPNQQVFVSHVNGKLQVRFCNLAMGCNSGTAFITSTGNLVEQ